MMTLGHLEIFTADLAASRRFYEEVLGFQVTTTQSDQLVWLQMGQQEILLRPGRTHDQTTDYQEANIGLVLYTDDLEKTAAELEERGLVFQGTDTSDRCRTFTDPDGNWLQLVNPNDY